MGLRGDGLVELENALRHPGGRRRGGELNRNLKMPEVMKNNHSEVARDA